MTLAQWLKSWPYIGRHFINGSLSQFTRYPDGTHVYVVSDAGSGQDHTRTYAFDLDDYRVTSVSGGSIWFTPKERI